MEPPTFLEQLIYTLSVQQYYVQFIVALTKLPIETFVQCLWVCSSTQLYNFWLMVVNNTSVVYMYKNYDVFCFLLSVQINLTVANV